MSKKSKQQHKVVPTPVAKVVETKTSSDYSLVINDKQALLITFVLQPLVIFFLFITLLFIKVKKVLNI